MLLPQEIAEQLKPAEYTELCQTVEEEYQQPFGVVKVTCNKGRVSVEIELSDRTRKDIVLSSNQNAK